MRGVHAKTIDYVLILLAGLMCLSVVRAQQGPGSFTIARLKYGGGGHENAGTCQIDNDDAERVLGELIEQITADG